MVLGEERSPCLVYNEESLNDTLFDLLCIGAFETVFYPVQANPHRGILEKASIFALAGASQKPDLGGMDIAATAETADALQWRHPEARFWLDPGFLAVSEAGALLIKAQTLLQHKEGFCIGTDSGKEIIIASGGKDPQQDVINLSSFDRRVGEHDDETVIGVSRHAPSFEAGDILLITNMGATQMHSTVRTGLLKFVTEHYLRARRICQVKI